VSSTNLVWNAQHHWLTMTKQFRRVAPASLNPKHLVDFLATQFILLNPLIAILAARAAPVAWREWSGPLAFPYSPDFHSGLPDLACPT